MQTMDKLISTLDLIAHPEGGYYQRIFTSATPAVFGCETVARVACTAIIYLLNGEQFSAFHRIKSDELWLLGEANTAFRIIELINGEWKETLLSRVFPVYCVKANTWFAAELLDKNETSFALAYCTVVPGFDFAEFEMATANQLSQEYPQYADAIRRLCLT